MTFKPTLIPRARSASPRSHRPRNQKAGASGHQSVFERLSSYVRSQSGSDNQNDCTFSPRINRSPRNVRNV